MEWQLDFPNTERVNEFLGLCDFSKHCTGYWIVISVVQGFSMF